MAVNQGKHRQPIKGQPLDLRNLLAAAALILVAFVVYFPVCRAGFILDDFWSITQNPLVKTAGGLSKIWLTVGRIPNETHYWPVVYSTLWLEYQLWGVHPLGYHLLNVALHAANALLIWRLLRRMAVPGAWLAALLFVVHPVHVESVAWTIEIKDLLSALFYLLAFYFFIGVDPEERKRRNEIPCSRSGYCIGLGAAAGCFVLALLSKSVAVTFPAALLVWFWWREGRISRAALWRVAPFFAIAILIGGADTLLARRIEQYHYPLGLGERLLLAGNSFWIYLRQIAWPQLPILYPRWTVAASAGQIAALLAAIGLFPALWLARGKIGRGPFAAAAFFALTLAPTLGLVGFGYLQFSFVADRFQYLASLGPIALAAAGLAKYSGMRNKAIAPEGARRNPYLFTAAFCIVVVCVFGTLTWRQAGYYHDEETLYQRARIWNPDSVLVNNGLATGLIVKRKFAEAEKYLRHAIAIKPDYGPAYVNLETVLSQLGREREALETLQQGAQQAKDLNIFNNLAWRLATSPDPAVRNPAEALEYAKKADDGSHNPAVGDTLAAAYAAMGQFDAAVGIAKAAQARAREEAMPELANAIASRLEKYQNHEAIVVAPRKSQ